jgi:hypothetical protein
MRSQKSTTMPAGTTATGQGATPASTTNTATPTGTMLPGTTFTDATPDTNSGGGNQGVLLGSSSEAGGVSWLASMATGDVSATPGPVVASVHLVAPLVTALALLCLHLQLFGKGM